jgi:hypothetical protein
MCSRKLCNAVTNKPSDFYTAGQFKLGFPQTPVYGLTLYDMLGNYFFELHKINTIHNNANNVQNILCNIQYYVRKLRLFLALAK